MGQIESERRRKKVLLGGGGRRYGEGHGVSEGEKEGRIGEGGWEEGGGRERKRERQRQRQIHYSFTHIREKNKKQRDYYSRSGDDISSSWHERPRCISRHCAIAIQNWLKGNPVCTSFTELKCKMSAFSLGLISNDPLQSTLFKPHHCQTLQGYCCPSVVYNTHPFTLYIQWDLFVKDTLGQAIFFLNRKVCVLFSEVENYKMYTNSIGKLL